MTTTNEVRPADVPAVRAGLIGRPDTVVLDVRTPGEFGVVRIAGALNLPVDQLAAHAGTVAAAGRPVVLVCQSGPRAVRAADLLVRAGAPDVVVLAGGMNAWITADAPVERPGSARWTLERQVRLVAGGIVAAGVLGSVWYPRLRFVAGAVGVGLVTAALTDTCAMASLLARLPHNRSATADVDATLARIRA